ncbi:MAG: hypothetical protein HXY23_07150 [Parvularculaceae bacterium]|jgi:hypothetical protein|nr:hypothetical protein [Parvularculaceae bacterium]
MRAKRRQGRSTIAAAPDSADAVRAAIAALEERINVIATSLMGTEEFARTANVAAQLQLRMKKGVNDHMARQLALFNMPSREDVSAIGERLMTMDERLIRIEAMLARLAGPAPAAGPRPPRTKKPAKRAKP